jgi:hypothetical protein
LISGCFTEIFSENSDSQDEDTRKSAFIIETIPLNEYSFDIRNLISERNISSGSIVIVLGWSRDGKILIFIKDPVSEGYQVRNLVEGGKILYDSFWRSPRVIVSTDPSNARTIISNIAKQYNIESITEEIGTFPYSGIDNNIYNIIMFPEKDGQYLVSGTYIYRTIDPDKRRLLAYIGGLYSLRDWYINNIVFLYTKSPFENRIAVIGIMPYGNVLLEPIPYHIGFWGVDLDSEF